MNVLQHRALTRGLGLAAAGLLAAGTGLASVPAHAGPPEGSDGAPGCLENAGPGTVTVPSGPIAEGTTITIQGTGFTAEAGTVISVKIDAFGPSLPSYKGSAANPAGPGDVVATFPLEAGGTFAKTFVIPFDIDDPAVNPTHAGPHFLRILAPGVSCWSNDFTTVDVAPPVVQPQPQPPATDQNAAVDAKITKVKAQLKKAKKAKKAAKVKKLKKKLKKLKQQRV